MTTKPWDSRIIWWTLTDNNIDPAYIHIVQKLYRMQKASVRTDVEGRNFNLQTGRLDQHSTVMAPLIKKWAGNKKTSDSTSTNRLKPNLSQIRRRHLTHLDDLIPATEPDYYTQRRRRSNPVLKEIKPDPATTTR